MADDDEWRFSLEDLEDRSDAAEDGAAGDAADTGDEHLISGKVADLDDAIEPESISLENAFFVLLGASLTVLTFLAFAQVI
jgi:hypothetical protein